MSEIEDLKEKLDRDVRELSRRCDERQAEHSRLLADVDKRSHEADLLSRDFNELRRRFEERQEEQTRRLNDAEARLRDAEGRLQTFRNAAWVVGIIAAIFGISGGFGLKWISEAKSEIDTLTGKVTALTGQVADVENKMKTWDEVVRNSLDQVTKQEGASRKALVDEQEVLANGLKGITASGEKALDAALIPHLKKLGEQSTAEISKIKASGATLFEPKGASDALAKKLDNGSLSLKCRRLTVVDGSGNPGLDLFTQESGGHAVVYHATSKPAVSLIATAVGGYLHLADPAGRDLVIAGYFQDSKQPFFALRNPEKSQPPETVVDAVLLHGAPEGGRITIKGAAGQQVLVLPK